MVIKLRGKRKPIALVEDVLRHSIADKIGIKSGDIINKINGNVLRDIIDYQYFSADGELDLEWETMEGKVHTAFITKDDDEDLGIRFTAAVFDGIQSCRNHCIFCFVDQMPKKHRKSLYVKDDDYRMSFLYGNYITLTNLREEDYERIIAERLSPLYISIHAVDARLREKLLGHPDETPILENLQRLAAGRISMHGQIVLCPGMNDGEALEETITAIAGLGDAFSSLALVPVGLTRYQKEPTLRLYRREEAQAVLAAVERWQRKFLEERGSRFLYASDEFYLFAEKEIPPEEEYEGYPQIENGVGLIRQFWEDFDYEKENLPHSFHTDRSIRLISGIDGEKALRKIVAELKKKPGLDIEIVPVKNDFFGETVTVTGLLTGEDIIEAIKQEPKGKRLYLLPDVLLKHGENLLLDDVSVEEIRERTGCEIKVVAADALGLIDQISSLG